MNACVFLCKVNGNYLKKECKIIQLYRKLYKSFSLFCLDYTETPNTSER
jgi:hypothetical protein